jgi:hypothetical protein
MEENEVLGYCPFCQGGLTRSGENLVCENGDYAVSEKRFDEIWEQFKRTYNAPGITNEAQSSLTEELLKAQRSKY